MDFSDATARFMSRMGCRFAVTGSRRSKVPSSRMAVPSFSQTYGGTSATLLPGPATQSVVRVGVSARSGESAARKTIARIGRCRAPRKLLISSEYTRQVFPAEALALTNRNCHADRSEDFLCLRNFAFEL